MSSQEKNEKDTLDEDDFLNDSSSSDDEDETVVKHNSIPTDTGVKERSEKEEEQNFKDVLKTLKKSSALKDIDKEKVIDAYKKLIGRFKKESFDNEECLKSLDTIQREKEDLEEEIEEKKDEIQASHLKYQRKGKTLYTKYMEQKEEDVKVEYLKKRKERENDGRPEIKPEDKERKNRYLNKKIELMNKQLKKQIGDMNKQNNRALNRNEKTIQSLVHTKDLVENNIECEKEERNEIKEKYLLSLLKYKTLQEKMRKNLRVIQRLRGMMKDQN